MACCVSPGGAPGGTLTVSFSPSQTPPGMSPSAGAYLQMAVSFNYRCLALFTDTGYIWMGLATLKVSSPSWAQLCRLALLLLIDICTPVTEISSHLCFFI